MPTYGNITPTPTYDGVVYAADAVMPSLESDLCNQLAPYQFPASINYGEAVQATAFFRVTGNPVTNSTYIVMQSDLGADGNWIDLAWLLWTGITGQSLFVLSSGVAGANAVQQSRAVGTAPASSGSNQITIGGRLRFVGKTTLGATVGGSSAGPGNLLQVTCTLRYKLLGLR